MEKLYKKHLPLAQQYAKARGGRLILELFMGITVLFTVLSLSHYYSVGTVNNVFLFGTLSTIFVSQATAIVCYFFFMKDWRRLQIWYFRNQIKNNEKLAGLFLDPVVAETITLKKLEKYVKWREREIRDEALEEDNFDQYVSAELALLDASRDTLYHQFCDQTKRKGEKYLKKAQKFKQILEEYYGVAQ